MGWLSCANVQNSIASLCRFVALLGKIHEVLGPCAAMTEESVADAYRYPVQAGDAIWMAPYVVQWYAALGTHNSRYILYKDTTLDPIVAT